MTRRPHTQKTNASATLAGFSYQEYYFLNELINIKMGQSVSFETEDDVYLSWESGEAVFVQIKYTSQKKSTLKKLDIDLWKTLYNWAKIIQDPAEGRTNLALQITFLNKKTFRFVTNKDFNKNSFFQNLLEFQSNSINIGDFRMYLQELSKKTKNNTIRNYINELLGLDIKVLEKFFLNIKLKKGEEDIISRCKQSIRENKVRDMIIINAIFRQISSEVKKNIHDCFKNRNKFTVSFEEFETRYGAFFHNLRTEKLPFQTIDYQIPEDILEFIFMRQLLDVKHVTSEEKIRYTKIATNFFNLKNNLVTLEQNGNITNDDIKKMEKAATNVWEREFHNAYRSVPPNAPSNVLKEKACDIIYNLKREQINLASTPLEPDLNDGVFYELSNRPIIGWLRDWEELYRQ
ncbi:hypothetical protein DTJ06_00865 [Parasaccharibacter sp. TMW 2.1886]|nr:hypothetical protein [Parasaccharibacter sp. TMW 2.1886]